MPGQSPEVSDLIGLGPGYFLSFPGDSREQGDFGIHTAEILELQSTSEPPGGFVRSQIAGHRLYSYFISKSGLELYRVCMRALHKVHGKMCVMNKLSMAIKCKSHQNIHLSMSFLHELLKELTYLTSLLGLCLTCHHRSLWRPLCSGCHNEPCLSRSVFRLLSFQQLSFSAEEGLDGVGA